MLDSDLLLLYEVKTKRLNEQVKRNLSRFPEDFILQLTEIEHDSLSSKIATLKKGRRTHQKYLPFAFTEHGVMMLPSVLKSDKAIQTNIQIMRIFTKVRQMLFDITEIRIDILHPEASGQKKLENHDKNIELVFSYLDELTEKKENESNRVKIGY